MREVLSISVTKEQKKRIMDMAKKAGMPVSTFIVSIVDDDREFMSEDELLEIAKQGEREYREGKAFSIESLKDLIKKDEDK